MQFLEALAVRCLARAVKLIGRYRVNDVLNAQSELGIPALACCADILWLEPRIPNAQTQPPIAVVSHLPTEPKKGSWRHTWAQPTRNVQLSRCFNQNTTANAGVHT